MHSIRETCTMTTQPEPDPLDALLASPAQAPDGLLRQSTWERSMRLLRRRRLLRRGAYLAGLVACYVSGLLTLHLRAPAAPIERERIVYRDRPAPVAPVPAEKPTELEQRALTAEKPTPELFRRAGDAYA